MPIDDTLTPGKFQTFLLNGLIALSLDWQTNLSLEYGVPAQVRAELAQRAAKLEEVMTDWSQEEASTAFQPSNRFYS